MGKASQQDQQEEPVIEKGATLLLWLLFYHSAGGIFIYPMLSCKSLYIIFHVRIFVRIHME